MKSFSFFDSHQTGQQGIFGILHSVEFWSLEDGVLGQQEI